MVEQVDPRSALPALESMQVQPLSRAEGKGRILGELSMVKARALRKRSPHILGSSDKPEPWGSAWKELEGFWKVSADLKRWRASPEV